MARTVPAGPLGPVTGPGDGLAMPAIKSKVTRLFTAPPVWRELLLLALFYTAYTLVRFVLSGGGTVEAFRNAAHILSFERALNIDIELPLNQALLDAPWLAKAANYFYATAHFAVTLAIVVWLYRFRPRQYRWLRTALMVATAIALIGFWLYPLAPPRFLPGEGFVDPVNALGSWGLYSSQASGALTNQYAAMPSMHAGWALWCGFVLVHLATQRWAKVLGVVYPVVTVLVILATANHYILDAIVGMAIVGTALLLSWLAYLRRPASLTRPAGRLATVLRPGAPEQDGDPQPTRGAPAVNGDAPVTSI